MKYTKLLGVLISQDHTLYFHIHVLCPDFRKKMLFMATESSR